MKKSLARFARWLLNKCEPPPANVSPLFAVCEHSELHGARARVIDAGSSSVDAKIKAMEMWLARGPHAVIRVVRFEPVGEWFPGNGP